MTTQSPARPQQTLTTLPIDAIAPNPMQPRKRFDEQALGDLAESVRMHGVVQPVVVTKSLSGYRLVVGERRWRAARAAGLTQIPAVICDYAEVEAMQVALVENIQRQDLNPIEEAQAIQFLLKEYAMTQEALAVRLGKSRPALSNTLRLLQLPSEIQHDLIDGTLSAGHARALVALNDATLQLKVWAKVKDDALSVRQTESLVRKLQERAQLEGGAPQPKPAPRATPEELLDVQQDMERWLQAQVKITPRSKSAGRIEVSYSSPDELERLIELFQMAGRRRPARVDLDLL